MRHWQRWILTLCIVVGVTASFFAARGAFARSLQSRARASSISGAGHVSSGLATCGSHWGMVASPYANGQWSTRLTGVAAVSANDMWAVGYDYEGFGYGGIGIIEHWNGVKWSIVPFQNPGGANVLFTGVAAISANNVMAVGYVEVAGGATSPLIEQWDGTSWSEELVNVGTGTLAGVAVVAANDIWAVGATGGSISRTFILHWDGSAWTQIASPTPDPSDELWSVTALSSSDVWAVGNGYTGGQYLALTEHWNGSAWSAVSSPSPDPVTNMLMSVAGISANDVWAVGYTYSQTLTEHWNGTTWSVVSSPSGPGGTGSLYGVMAVSSSDVWAVGNYLAPIPPNNQTVQQALTEHWNGMAWSIVPATNPSVFNNSLYAVVAMSTNDVWAVGAFTSGQSGQVGNTLIEHYPALFVGTPRSLRIAKRAPSGAIACQ